MFIMKIEDSLTSLTFSKYFDFTLSGFETPLAILSSQIDTELPSRNVALLTAEPVGIIVFETSSDDIKTFSLLEDVNIPDDIRGAQFTFMNETVHIIFKSQSGNWELIKIETDINGTPYMTLGRTIFKQEV